MLRKLLLSCTAMLLAGSVLPAEAADHNDAPDLMSSEGSFLDLTDVYVYRSPTNPDNLVIQVGLFAPEVAATPPLFADTGRYDINIDTNNDFVSDNTVRATFETAQDGAQTFRFDNVPGAGTVTGAVSTGAEPIVVTSGPVKAFAGLRDDPFFFDLVAFQMFVKAPCVPAAGLRCRGTGAPVNFFAGRNTSTIIIEFPAAALPNVAGPNQGKLNVWSKTFSN